MGGWVGQRQAASEAEGGRRRKKEREGGPACLPGTLAGWTMETDISHLTESGLSEI